MNVKIGDQVRFLNSVGGGRVVRIDGRTAYVDEDGFETPVLVSECVVVGTSDSFYKVERPGTKAPEPTPEPVKPAAKAPEPQLEPVVETAEGEHLNIVLGFEPDNIKRLSDTSFDASLVNDSNYCLWLTVATRSRDDERWTLRFRGMIEPQIQEFLFELTVADLPDIDRIAVQALPFKTADAYTLKAPVAYEHRLDVTKFARLHCFTSNPYFDGPVLAIDVVKDDVTQGAPITVDPKALEQAIAQKTRIDAPKPKPHQPKADPNAPLEVDLHASALLDTTAGLSRADILNYQIDTFRRVMDENLNHPGRVIIFIHGKGEGVLRQALTKELTHRYKGHDVSDASFREYGFGATKVVIRKNIKP